MSVKLFNNPKNGQVAGWLKQRPLKGGTYGSEVVGGNPTNHYRLNSKTLVGLLEAIPGLIEVLKKDIINDAERIMVGVGVRFGFNKQELQSKSRKAELVSARQIGMYIIRNRYDSRISLKTIGDLYGRDHATVLHAMRQVDNLIETSKSYNRQVDELINILT